MTEPLLIGLAAWRLALLIVEEDGPFSLPLRLRVALIPSKRARWWSPRVFAHGIVSCVWCAGVWAAFACWACYAYVSPVPVIIAAAAGAVVMLHGVHRCLASLSSPSSR